jgi:acyl-coenzyme A thioesterase PaaI-like protein
MKPCAGPFAIAHAQLRRLGRTLGWVDVEIHDARGSPCVIARGHYLAQVG